MVRGATGGVAGLGISMIAEDWEYYDTLLHDREELRLGWRVMNRDDMSKLTFISEVRYKKIYFHNTRTGERYCRLDRIMGFAEGEWA